MQRPVALSGSLHGDDAVCLQGWRAKHIEVAKCERECIHVQPLCVSMCVCMWVRLCLWVRVSVRTCKRSCSRSSVVVTTWFAPPPINI